MADLDDIPDLLLGHPGGSKLPPSTGSPDDDMPALPETLTHTSAEYQARTDNQVLALIAHADFDFTTLGCEEADFNAICSGPPLCCDDCGRLQSSVLTFARRMRRLRRPPLNKSFSRNARPGRRCCIGL